MKKIDLVFRTIGERSAKLALDFACKNIEPNNVYIIENIRPFSQAVRQMLRIDYDSDFVVFMDADCLILEDMRQFLQTNTWPHIDGYILDKFRGRVHAGIHITRIDIVRAMQRTKIPEGDKKYILKPESKLRSIALRELNQGEAFKKFRVFHDFFQFYRDIFAKYMLRELRSRKYYNRIKLNLNMQDWPDNDVDYIVARRAIDYARHTFESQPPSAALAELVASLPAIAKRQLEQMSIQEKPPLTLQKVLDLNATPDVDKKFRGQQRVFGIGLDCSGAKSLTEALNVLGCNVAYYPTNEETFAELVAEQYTFSLLDDFDGITGITVAPFYKQLDKLYPNSKFILTVRDKESWLATVARQWKAELAHTDKPKRKIKQEIKKLLRTAAYGCQTFNEKQLSHAYDLHHKNVGEYFQDRPESLLVLDTSTANSWDKLCPFLNKPVPVGEAFPDASTKRWLYGSWWIQAFPRRK